MKILITGVHGFVGSNLVEYLKKHNEIYGLDIVSPEKEGVVKTFSWEDLASLRRSPGCFLQCVRFMEDGHQDSPKSNKG